MRKAGAWLKYGLVALALAGTACGSDGESERERTSEALELWRSKAPLEYTFVYSRGCYCPMEYVMPVRVVVRRGQVVSARFADGSSAGSRKLTIDDLHQEILSWLDGKPAQLEAEYDSTWGYPRTAQADGDEAMVDDEMALAVTCFAPNAHDDACPLSASA